MSLNIRFTQANEQTVAVFHLIKIVFHKISDIFVFTSMQCSMSRLLYTSRYKLEVDKKHTVKQIL